MQNFLTNEEFRATKKTLKSPTHSVSIINAFNSIAALANGYD